MGGKQTNGMMQSVIEGALSGDVSQAILPWSLYMNHVLQQRGFININNFNSRDPDLEREIVHDVAGYGSQLGTIMDAVCMLLQKFENTPALATMSKEEQRIQFRLEELHDKIDALKKEAK